MNTNPIYLQEVSSKYYHNILANSRQTNAAERLAKKWLKKNPNTFSSEKIDKFKNIIKKIHNRYDKARGRDLMNTMTRNKYMSRAIDLKNNPIYRSMPKKLNDELHKSAFKTFKAEKGADAALKQFLKLNKSKSPETIERIKRAYENSAIYRRNVQHYIKSI